MQALQGIRIVDFSHVIAGPFASYLLAQLGAEVIKVESPGRGEGLRGFAAGDSRFDGMSPLFLSVNGGKRSIALDLRSEDGLEVARKLIAQSDVVLENLRPGAMKRLGLGYEDAKAIRSDIIYCSISGFGQHGPRSQRPAIDNVVQAASGLASLGQGGGLGFPLVDTYTATIAALALTQALLRRERGGGGQFIDVAMLDSTITLMASVVTPHLATGGETAPRRDGRKSGSPNPTNGVFAARDGINISLGASGDDHFARLVEVLDLPELATNPNFAARTARFANAEALISILNGAFLTRDAEEWEAALSAVNVPCAVIRSIGSALEDATLRERGALYAVPSPLEPGGTLELTGVGFTANEGGPALGSPPPRAGEHSRDILRELGFADTRIDTLIAAGAVTQAAGNDA